MKGTHSLGIRLCVLLAIASVLFLAVGVQAQETTGGLQGTVKDQAGAVVPNALVELTGSAQIGAKTINTDGTGYYRFTNLPPGTYTVTVKQSGFQTLQRGGIVIEVGHLPTLDLALKVGSESTVVEVTAEAPLIDLTTSHTSTNLPQEVLADTPHGYSFQSVIQFAPSARNEPLQGYGAGININGNPIGGTGGSLPGSSGNGLAFGYSVGGAADSENSYLVEGQDTENISGGYSNANVPFQFIQEVQVKSSGIEAEHGGAIGGVINVIMRKGSNDWHGQLAGTYESTGIDASPNQYLRYDPTSSITVPTAMAPLRADSLAQSPQPKEDHLRILQPSGTIGGAILKDRIWFFAGFAPLYTGRSRKVNFSPTNPLFLAQSTAPLSGVQNFTQDTQQYFGNVRIDAAVTQKIRVFGSWLAQYTRRQGVLPIADLTDPNFLNQAITLPLAAYAHGIGYSAPNETFNVGADVTITPRIVSTTRYGYFFQNYHDFGWPLFGANLDFLTTGLGGVDTTGAALPPALQETAGSQSSVYKQQYTLFNAGKHYQFDEDVAIFKSGWWGTHNFKFGYQYNHLALNVSQNGNIPLLYLLPGAAWRPITGIGVANCAPLIAANGKCEGQYGTAFINDFSTIGTATDTNHGLFAQDAWTIGHGVTLNVGIRIEKETLPPPPGEGIIAGHTINFGWSDKVEPRLGGAWDVFKDGRLKLFASYGVVNDIMKLLLAEVSWGSQAFEECAYGIGPNAAGTFDPSMITPVYINNRACPTSVPSTLANWAGGVAPSGFTFIENDNLRPTEPVAPGVLPYRQHESTFGIDYALAKNWALEVRWDRRRLDHILEDASLTDVNNGEVYAVVNPGEGVNKTLDGYAAFLGSLGQSFGTPGYDFTPGNFGSCPSCVNPKAARSYDGVEFRLTKAVSRNFSGLFSYTYSKLRGNYTGLTTSEQTDGAAAGRDSPDTSRSFDEPYFYFNRFGGSSSGPLPTDRPNTLKGYVYYTLPEGHRNTTTIGLFQTAYQGAPVSSFIDVGAAFPPQPGYAMYLWNRGKYVNVTTDALGNITFGAPYTRRTPWFNQTDLHFSHDIKVEKNNEHRVFTFGADAFNTFNQKTVTSIYGGINETQTPSVLIPGISLAGNGAAAYSAYEHGFNPQLYVNGANPVTLSSWYNKPFTYQLGRTMILNVSYTF